MFLAQFRGLSGGARDSPALAEFRQRMATDEAQEIYKQRAATAECVNAQARNRGLGQFRVRGQPKVWRSGCGTDWPSI